MPLLSRPAFGPAAALGYVTSGSLLCVWTLVWYFTREYELTRSQWFWIGGLFLTGITLVTIGLVIGRIGRAARQAEMPPPEAIRAEAAIQQTAAANPPVVANPPIAVNPPMVANPSTAANPPAVAAPNKANIPAVTHTPLSSPPAPSPAS